MTTEQTRAIAYRVYEAINAQDMDALEALFDPQIVRHAMGEVGFDKAKATTLKAFETTPTLRFVVEDVLADGDRAALRVTVHGRPLEPGQSPPMILEIFRVANGRVAEIWGAGTSPRRG